MASEKTSQGKGPIMALVLMIILAACNLGVFLWSNGQGGLPLLVYYVGSPILAGILLFILLPSAAPAGREESTQRPVSVAESLPPRVTPMPPKPTPGPALTLLATLQAEGRLVDFLQEPIAAYSDDQIGAAVRAIHEGCRKALAERMGFEPVLSGSEGDEVTVPPGFDPSAIRLTGNVAGQPPFRGTLRHHGWRAVKVKLAERPTGQDPNIIAPAEVEIT